MKVVVAVSLAWIVLFSLPGMAGGAEEEVSACWVEYRSDPVTGTPRPVTVCRVAGELVEYGSGGSPPSDLDPDVGTAGGVQCWFWTGRDTQWVFVALNPDNTATLGWDPDGVPGGPVAVDITLEVCRSEPVPAAPPSVEVWEAVREYVHAVPVPVLDPPPPRGLAGLETYAGVEVPDPLAVSLVSAGSGAVLEVEAWVDEVTVDWGDGTVDSFPPVLFPFLDGSAEGAAVHVFEVKTCDPPGGPRCHPSLSAYPLSVSFSWFVRWRVGGGPWLTLPVPDTVTVVDYPVSEVVGLVTG